ncbi:MAG TPA: hypothetical protein DCZ68_06505 [Faecalibacterium sp.]|nr:hypothetical protein [Faecalibacterium sp.]
MCIRGKGNKKNVKHPLSLAALASSPKGTPFGSAGNFVATSEAVPLGKVAATNGSRRKGFP